MPAPNAVRKWKTLSSAYRKRRRASSLPYVKRPRKMRRMSFRRVRTSPNAAPNVYNFTRGFDSYGFVDSDTGIFKQNTDSQYLIISLAAQFSDLPDYTEFNSLFSEYKINSFDITLTPNFTNNQYTVLNADNSVARVDIRNYQCFAVPVNYTDEAVDFSAFTGAQIDNWLNCTQRKRVTVFPGKVKKYRTLNPRVVKYEGALDKALGVSTAAMGKPYWLSTAAPTGQNPDERTVQHYGIRLLIRRVDGSALSATSNPMGWRVQHQVHFSCRKVQ